MLTFVPTPIGNLGDISFRTIEVLKDTELILCEDTRVTKKLLNLISAKLEITFPPYEFISIHSHNEKEFVSQNDSNLIIKNCIYMTDAGMPCVSDPGSFLVDFCLNNNIEYDVLPGANAILTAYASSGFTQNATSFTFFGFLPHKGKNRSDMLDKVMNSENLAILYESPHRLLKLLEELNKIDSTRTIFLTKELTKKFQTRYKGTVSDILEEISKTEIKGEWVIVIEQKELENRGIITYDDLIDLKLPPKQKAKLISKLTGENIKDIYNNLIS
ncbi:MAG: 16S rRNA (cytidine(1402)-2'-O)-methyltransferase [Campylobacterota bacterium]|nr:16S rRNA (cytidine(1402)-2'-O)-methyltransferase [Campylobacterota bacterium]